MEYRIITTNTGALTVEQYSQLEVNRGTTVHRLDEDTFSISMIRYGNRTDGQELDELDDLLVQKDFMVEFVNRKHLKALLAAIKRELKK